jgi:O-antigen/teichoic acid export membrane protein
MVATLFPAFSERTTHSDTGAVSRLYSEAVRYLALLLLPCFGFLIVFGPEVLRLWMGAQFAAQAGLVMRLVAFGALLNAFAYIPRVALQGTGRPDLTAKIYLIEVPVYLAACVFLIQRFGVLGAAWAAIFRFGLDSALLYGAADRFTRCTLRSVWERGIVPVALSAVALNAGFMIVRRLPGSHIVHLAEAAALGLAYLPLAWWFVLDEQDKPFIRRVLNVFRVQPLARAAGAAES